MPMNMTFNSSIPAFVVELDAALLSAALAGGEAVQQIAQETVAIDTGSLQETIDVEQVQSSEGLHVMSVNAGNVEGGYKGGGAGNKSEGAPVDYAVAQEYGGGPGAYKPYMTPASEEGWADVQRVAEDAIRGIAGAS